jgi:hypothetical protein
MSGLTTDKNNPLSKDDEIDNPVHKDQHCYSTGLCYALAIKDYLISKGLLMAGANPNLTTLQQFGSSLIIATKLRKESPDLLQLLLETHKMDIYVIDNSFKTAFMYARGDAQFVLCLLTQDPGLEQLSKVIKDNLSENIAKASLADEARVVNKMLCDTIGKWYDAVGADADFSENKSFIENELDNMCGQPIGTLVSSYLFFNSKPASLQHLEVITHIQEKNNESYENKHRDFARRATW